MEAVAAVSSIAGILSLAGQAVNGIIILRGFFQDCASESHTIERFLKKLNDLIQILEHARDLMTKLRVAPSKIVPESILASLEIQLEHCNKDVYRWLTMAKTCLPASYKGTKAAFKKFLVALEKQRITDVYGEISAHKGNIMTKLSMIGRCFDIDQSTTLNALCKRLKVWDGIEQSRALANGEKQDTMVLSYEIVSQPGSSSSLASIAESLSRIENKMGDIMGSNSSQYGSQPKSIRSFGSFDSGSLSGGLGRAWSSEPSRSSIFTALGCNESISGSISERITQSLLGIRNQTLPSSYRHFNASHDEEPTTSPFHGTNQHLPQDDCLTLHFAQSTQMFKEGFIQEATKYIDLILLAETIIFKIKLFKTAPSILFGLSDQIVQSEIDALEGQLHTISSEAKVLLTASWREGINTADLDSYMAKCRNFGSGISAISHAIQEKGLYKKDTGVSVLTDNKPHPRPLTTDATRHDRINMWLLNNLEASDKERKLHRSFLPGAVTLDKEQWERMVLKYWPLDEAATGPEDKCFSSNGAVGSDGMCHSERVMFENPG